MTWRFIDTHCHLEQTEFNHDRAAIIKNALDSKIAMITSAISEDSWNSGIELTEKYDGIFTSIGLDPTGYEKCENAIGFIKQYSSDIVSIGEVGLDHYRTRDHLERDRQEEVFRRFIKLSIELNLPIQIHSRSAGKKAIDVLDDMSAGAVHMHAFDGKSSYARTASRDLGYYFSIPPSVVRSPQKQKLVKAIDLEKLLLETDSPVLGPERGVRNNPNNIRVALQKVSEILGRDEEELRKIIMENTLRLYTKIR
ncbi:MAG: putative deoxyribonuclease YcfH [Candidatus Thorarchaeota archaeon]|nr:MAG: putative deoxyribonuclease YcfH [Candidatus Thorarchaeota archaeon]